MFERIKMHVRGFRRETEWHRRHGSRAPRVGNVAPEFELCDAKGENPVRLSAFRGRKSVALVFGSWT